MRYFVSSVQKRWVSLCCILMILSFLTAGCATSGKPQYDVEKFLLHYPAPSREKQDELAVSVKFNRFSIAAAYNSTGMIFRNDNYSIDSFNYSRWAVNPADMIADRLLEDMRGSGLFQTVFDRYETDDGRFNISGGIEEFYLRMDGNNKVALISITISLQDTSEKEIGKRMMYQKKYTREEPLPDASPRGYCEAASRAMQTISREIISDVYAGIKTRTAQTTGSP